MLLASFSTCVVVAGPRMASPRCSVEGVAHEVSWQVRVQIPFPLAPRKNGLEETHTWFRIAAVALSLMRAAAKRARPAPTATSTQMAAAMAQAMRFAQAQSTAEQAAHGLAVVGRSERPVAVLPLEVAEPRLRAHPILLYLRNRTDVRRVHHCMVEMLAMPADARGERDPLPQMPRPQAAHRSACCGAASEVNPERSAWVCTSCGAVQSGFLCNETPHRYFAEDRYDGKVDPNHWSCAESEDAEWWPEVDQLLPQAFAGRATSSQSDEVRRWLDAYCLWADGRRWRLVPVGMCVERNRRELVHDALARALLTRTEFTQTEWDAFRIAGLRCDHVVRAGGGVYEPAERKQLSNRWAAVAAAWIIVENPEVLTDRRVGMTEADLPAPRFACTGCPQAFHVRRELRLHAGRCTGGSR